MKKKALLAANFAPPLLSAMPNAVKIGAGIGGGLGLLGGAGAFESDSEKKDTNVGNRLGKILTSTTVGAGLGAGAGYAVNRYKTAPERGLERREAAVNQYKAENPTGVRKAVANVKREVGAVTAKLAPPTREQELEKAEAVIRQNLQAPNPPAPLIDQAIGLERQVAKSFQDGLSSLKDRFLNRTSNNTSYTKYMANFQDPATLQRLIHKGSTFIEPSTQGVVSLEQTLRGKMQKKKADKGSSMGVGEIKKMIESGAPTGKYFSKTVRKSANFNFVNNALVGAGKMLTQPLARGVRKAAKTASQGGAGSVMANNIASRIPFGNHDASKAAAGAHRALTGAGNYLDTDQAAKLAALGVGGLGLVGGGLLATRKKEAQYRNPVRKSANFMIPAGLVKGAQKVAGGATNRFMSLSPQINAANIGTAAGAGLGALEGAGINETEEQRRSTGLVGRAAKLAGMTTAGGVVGRGIGSAAGAGANRYQQNKRLVDNKAKYAADGRQPTTTTTTVNKPRSITIEDDPNL